MVTIQSLKAFTKDNAAKYKALQRVPRQVKAVRAILRISPFSLRPQIFLKSKGARIRNPLKLRQMIVCFGGLQALYKCPNGAYMVFF